MADARAEVLARVRRALADVDVEPSEPVREYRFDAGLDRAEVLALFIERAADYRVGVRTVADRDLAAGVAEIAAEHGARRIAVPADLPGRWRPPDLDLIEDAGLSAAELDDVDGALTASELAIAETGTVVLAAGPGQGRRAISLVPDLHICVVDAAAVVASVPEAISRLGRAAGPGGPPLTFVSGPSATADIELNRVEGVHGPRRLELLVVDSAR